MTMSVNGDYVEFLDEEKPVPVQIAPEVSVELQEDVWFMPGPQGIQGIQGVPGLTWRGAWAAATVYAVDDAVTYDNSSYRRLVAGTTATAPSADATNWELIAAKGVADDASLTVIDANAASAFRVQQDARQAAPKWTAAQAVVVGSVRQAPDGSWIKSTSARTTGATFDVTEQTFWTAVLGVAGTIAQVALSATYAPAAEGVPPGGTTGQVLAKASNTDNDVAWTAGGGTGDVVGPASATTDRLAAFDGTTGKLIKDSGKAVADLVLATEKGSASGVATLDTGGKVPAGQLPSYVDDVLEYANLAGFPATGTAGIIYVALDTNKTYRWSGSAYVEISPSDVNSVAGKTGAVTLVKADVGLGNVDNVSQQALADLKTEAHTFAVTGAVTVAAGKSRIYVEGNYTIVTVRASVNTAPTGASLICDVSKNGTTIYTTQANRPTIAASGFTATANSPNVTTFVSGDYLTVDVDQIGSTIAGSDLTVTIRLRRTS